jgi:uncharacterized coiled-coil protein SlyX
MNTLTQLQETVSNLQEQMKSLDERISFLEQDAYEKHTNDMDEDSVSESESVVTIIINKEENETNTNNLDIRETQFQLNEKLNKMSETMTQFALLLNKPYTNDTPPFPSHTHSASQ